jgi:hypothetical protein
MITSPERKRGVRAVMKDAVLYGSIAFALPAALIVFYATVYIPTRGVRVTVENHGAATLRAVVVHVTGNSYPLGDLKPMSSRSVKVNPRGESHVEIEYTDESGRPVRLNAGGYFESGYHGTVWVGIRDGRIDAVQQNVDPLFAW